MGCQTNHYSRCVSVTQFTLYGQFDFSSGQLSTFYMVNSSFYVVDFLLLIMSTFHYLYGQVDFLYGHLFTFYISQCYKDCRLKTADQG